MREKLETLPLAVLRDIAKDKQIKHYSTLKKAELVDILAKLAEQESNAAAKDVTSEQKESTTERKESTTERKESTTEKKEGLPERKEEENTVRPPVPADPYRQDYDPEMVDKSGEANGILEVLQEGYGFIRCENFLPGENDVYVSPPQIKRFGLKTGDIIHGCKRIKSQGEKFSALLYIKTVNGLQVSEIARRKAFEKLTPIFPDNRIHLELPGSSVAMRIVDLISPIGKGQRGMIVSQPKAGKTTLLKQIANSILKNHKEMHLMILLIDERPEEVTDIKEALEGDNVEVIYSTFDELPERHKRVSEMTIERAKRLVEQKQDVVILLDSITRLARAYNIVCTPSGRTLSGGLDPAALYMPKRFFGAARNTREGGSLTILATALVDTGSKMDDVVYEEFKGTGNMELVLDRKLSEKRIFPAIDIVKSGTRREDLLLTPEELDAMNYVRKALNGSRAEDATENIIDLFARTKNNHDFVAQVKKIRLF
ncbi:MAG: transcription termination factor Rho [Lachnospiraceae bacterium]